MRLGSVFLRVVAVFVLVLATRSGVLSFTSAINPNQAAARQYVTFTLTADPNPALVGQTVTLTATWSGPLAEGIVHIDQYNDSSCESFIATLAMFPTSVGAGSAQFTPSMAGTYYFKAFQPPIAAPQDTSGCIPVIAQESSPPTAAATATATATPFAMDLVLTATPDPVAPGGTVTVTGALAENVPGLSTTVTTAGFLTDADCTTPAADGGFSVTASDPTTGTFTLTGPAPTAEGTYYICVTMDLWDPVAERLAGTASGAVTILVTTGPTATATATEKPTATFTPTATATFTPTATATLAPPTATATATSTPTEAPPTTTPTALPTEQPVLEDVTITIETCAQAGNCTPGAQRQLTFQAFAESVEGQIVSQDVPVSGPVMADIGDSAVTLSVDLTGAEGDSIYYIYEFVTGTTVATFTPETLPSEVTFLDPLAEGPSSRERSTTSPRVAPTAAPSSSPSAAASVIPSASPRELPPSLPSAAPSGAVSGLPNTGAGAASGNAGLTYGLIGLVVTAGVAALVLGLRKRSA